jgi:hypothetical protein
MQLTMAEKKVALSDAQLVESELRAEWLRIQIDQARRKVPQQPAIQSTTTGTMMCRLTQKKA